jgi:ribosome biogenesis GTPase / thiamine phosphate phosphatase
MRESLLSALGCDDGRRAEVQDKQLAGVLGRVTRVDLGVVSILADDGPRQVHTAKSDSLIVGDWVTVEEDVLTRLERRTEVSRRTGVHRDERQALVANVDAVLIVCALDVGPHLSRLSTFVVIAYDAGAVPIVVLTKSDLSDDPEGERDDVSIGLAGVETMVVSTVTGEGLEELRQRIAGLTIVLLGESGAGKSTLTNELCGREQLATAAVRRGGQGRHTTTHRELVIIPSGGVIIDTPGIRVVASFGDGEGVDRAFDDVVALADHCRFSDCDHIDTPGCAIALALADGAIDQERVASYQRERREQARLDRRLAQRSRAEERKSAAQRKRSLDPTMRDTPEVETLP